MRMLGKARTLARPLALPGVLSGNHVRDLGALGDLIWAPRRPNPWEGRTMFAPGPIFAYACFPFERGSGSRIFRRARNRGNPGTWVRILGCISPVMYLDPLLPLLIKYLLICMHATQNYNVMKRTIEPR